MTVAVAAPGSSVADDYLRAVLDGDRRRAFEVIDDARARGMDLSALYMRVLQPSLREIGRLWQENRIGVAEEHLATAITQSAMARSFEQVFSWREQAEDDRRSIVAACADVERHEVGLRMLTDLLDVRGWQTTYLGASVPVESLVAIVYRRRPSVVALSAALAPHIPRVRSMVEGIRARMDEPPLIIVGGRPFVADPGLAERVGADLTAADAELAVEALVHRFPDR